MINAFIPYLHAGVGLIGANTYGKPVGQIGGFTYAPPSGTTAVALTIQRVVQQGGATVSPILFVDGCGEWRTFVGGGPDAFR